ncbi:MAG: hypothetical protein ACTSPI_00810 [Candidatus Heimdallarchaeaceae archaeon]
MSKTFDVKGEDCVKETFEFAGSARSFKEVEEVMKKLYNGSRLELTLPEGLDGLFEELREHEKARPEMDGTADAIEEYIRILLQQVLMVLVAGVVVNPKLLFRLKAAISVVIDSVIEP